MISSSFSVGENALPVDTATPPLKSEPLAVKQQEKKTAFSRGLGLILEAHVKIQEVNPSYSELARIDLVDVLELLQMGMEIIEDSLRGSQLDDKTRYAIAKMSHAKNPGAPKSVTLTPEELQLKLRMQRLSQNRRYWDSPGGRAARRRANEKWARIRREQRAELKARRVS